MRKLAFLGVLSAAILPGLITLTMARPGGGGTGPVCCEWLVGPASTCDGFTPGWVVCRLAGEVCA
jgi:hypothetical protein